MRHSILTWVSFLLFVFFLFVLDLGVFHRKHHEIKVREALLLSAFWIALSLLFNVGVYFLHGKTRALEFLAGYVIEKSLSMDNIFVFLVIFKYFSVPAQYQHKVLFWGIIGALAMRAIFIAVGVTLIHKFHWVIYVFGVFLIFTGYKMLTQKEKEIHPEKNPLLKLFKKFMPVVNHYDEAKFFTKENGKRCATPLFVVLLVIETTDVIFAVDSIPAILAISRDPFIVYTSNVFAILGLRALYFALAGIMPLFHYLHYGLSAILIFVGAKMLITDIYKVPIGIALGVVAGILLLSILVSVLFSKKEEDILPSAEDHDR